MLPEVGADVVGRVVGADHDALFAVERLAAGVLAGVMLHALELLGARELRHVCDAGHARGQHQLLRAQHHRLAAALDNHAPLAGHLIVCSALGLAGAPVVQLHHLGVHLQPIADLVLGGKDWPVVGEGHVRQVIVPDRIVQAERLIALAPRVAGALVLLDNDRGHAKALEAGAHGDPTLPAADDHAVGLRAVAKLGLGLILALLPVLAILEGAVLHPARAGGAALFLKAFKLRHRGEQRPAAVALQADLAFATRHGGLEGKPALAQLGRASGLAGERPAAGPHVVERGVEHGLDGGLALQCCDIPGEADQIAPVAVVIEHGDGRRDVCALERRPKARQPCGNPLRRRTCIIAHWLLLVGSALTRAPIGLPEWRR